MRRSAVLVTTIVVAVAVSAGASTGVAQEVDPATGPEELTDALAAIEGKPKYDQSDWGYSVIDAKSGEVVAAQNDQKMFDPGSTMKVYAVSTALRLYDPDYQFHTPVYRQGDVTGDLLDGNLVLVASGDLSFGLREQPDGTLYYENTPDLDHSYANVGLAGAVEPPGNPLTGLDELAAAVRGAGITRVSGDVVIDDRLFAEYDGFPDGLISPIWVNENLIDVQVTPGDVGQTATIDWRPMTATYTVESQVETVDEDTENPAQLQVTEPIPGHLVVTGDVIAGGPPTLVVKEVDDPSAFARTAFIEALQRAGVTVTATPTGTNPASLLPTKDSYQPADMLGEHVSATLAQYANLILKVSYNRGADLMTCLAAVEVGSTDCEQGLVEEVKTITDVGVSKTGVYPQDGAGSDDQGRSTPGAMAKFLKEVASESYGEVFADSLPVLGKNGTLANVLPKASVAGHAQVKTGNRATGTPAGQVLLLGNSLAGYVDTESGRRVVFMIAVDNVPLATSPGIFKVTNDQARMVAAIYRLL
jgi:D-alanyl-D-alanine carboxypeptidase/D-alanyl-D-alanine-endopeptidase (penicillin-binding protein 4)